MNRLAGVMLMLPISTQLLFGSHRLTRPVSVVATPPSQPSRAPARDTWQKALPGHSPARRQVAIDYLAAERGSQATLTDSIRTRFRYPCRSSVGSGALRMAAAGDGRLPGRAAFFDAAVRRCAVAGSMSDGRSGPNHRVAANLPYCGRSTSSRRLMNLADGLRPSSLCSSWQ